MGTDLSMVVGIRPPPYFFEPVPISGSLNIKFDGVNMLFPSAELPFKYPLFPRASSDGLRVESVASL